MINQTKEILTRLLETSHYSTLYSQKTERGHNKSTDTICSIIFFLCCQLILGIFPRYIPIYLLCGISIMYLYTTAGEFWKMSYIVSNTIQFVLIFYILTEPIMFNLLISCQACVKFLLILLLPTEYFIVCTIVPRCCCTANYTDKWLNNFIKFNLCMYGFVAMVLRNKKRFYLDGYD